MRVETFSLFLSLHNLAPGLLLCREAAQHLRIVDVTGARFDSGWASRRAVQVQFSGWFGLQLCVVRTLEITTI